MLLGASVWSWWLWVKRVQVAFIGFFCLLSTASIFLGGISPSVLSSGFQVIGLYSFGGALGLLGSCIILGRVTPEYRRSYWEAAVLSAPVMYACGKIGCIYSGCCYGIPYAGKFAVNTVHGQVFPIQALEAIVFLMIFICIIAFAIRKKLDYDVAVIVYATAKFGLDFIRYTHQEALISFNQILCIAVVCIVLVLRIYRGKGEN